MVFVGIAGLPYSGREEAVHVLVQSYGYELLSIEDMCLMLSTLCTSKEQPSQSGISNIPSRTFPSYHELINHVLDHYQKNFAILFKMEEFKREEGPTFFEIVDSFGKRPCFMLLATDCSLKKRVERAQKTEQMDLNNIIEIESSVIMSQFIKCASRILVTEKDSGSLLEWMHKEMTRLEPTFQEAVRPSWNTYFMELAHLASQRSNCMKRRVGAVLVSVQSHHILSTGYNGTPRGIPNCCEGGCARCNSNKGAGLDLTSCICLHAEENALLEVGSERISKNKKGGGVVLYCTTCPCLGCAKKMIQCGVSGVYYAHNYHMDDRVHALFKQANVNCIQFDI